MSMFFFGDKWNSGIRKIDRNTWDITYTYYTVGVPLLSVALGYVQYTYMGADVVYLYPRFPGQ